MTPPGASPPAPAILALLSGLTEALDARVVGELRRLEVSAGTALFEDLTATFRKDAPPRIAEMRVAIGVGDATGLRALAHRLRGGAGTLGAKGVVAAALAIESAAETRTSGELTALVDQLAQASEDAAKALDTFIARVRA
jgi:HPt (histidine-containing phosphotransfer) domain-containing protein